MSESYSKVNLVAVSEMIERFQELDKEPFLEAYPYPVVITDEPGSDENGEATFHTIGARPDSDSSSGKADRILAQVGRWAFQLRKKSRFASMVTLGRVAGSDIRINISSVSKFHAYFTHVAREQSWYLSDANSSNGTFLAGQELPASHGKVKLEDGTMVRFGPDVTCQYFSSEGLWTYFSERFSDMPSSESASALPSTPTGGDSTLEASPEG
ncbi:MAG: FHA domain-containing protein [Planctomycetes bacterium]|nr:FHA domain-containing protein [Planctomycetota bacterium]